MGLRKTSPNRLNHFVPTLEGLEGRDCPSGITQQFQQDIIDLQRTVAAEVVAQANLTAEILADVKYSNTFQSNTEVQRQIDLQLAALAHLQQEASVSSEAMLAALAEYGPSSTTVDLAAEVAANAKLVADISAQAAVWAGMTLQAGLLASAQANARVAADVAAGASAEAQFIADVTVFATMYVFASADAAATTDVPEEGDPTVTVDSLEARLQALVNYTVDVGAQQTALTYDVAADVTANATATATADVAATLGGSATGGADAAVQTSHSLTRSLTAALR